MARLSNKSMKKRLRSLHLNLFFVHYFSTRDLLAISARIAATYSSCLNIKTVSTFRGDIVFLLRIRIQKFLPSLSFKLIEFFRERL